MTDAFGKIVRLGIKPERSQHSSSHKEKYPAAGVQALVQGKRGTRAFKVGRHRNLNGAPGPLMTSLAGRRGNASLRPDSLQRLQLVVDFFYRCKLKFRIAIVVATCPLCCVGPGPTVHFMFFEFSKNKIVRRSESKYTAKKTIKLSRWVTRISGDLGLIRFVLVSE